MCSCLLFLIVFFPFLVTCVQAKSFTLQSNNPRSNHEIRHLKNASNGKVVIVNHQEPLSINFCVREKSVVRLADFRFSHANRSAMFTVNLDHGDWMGTYYSPPNGGWENFIRSGVFPKAYDFDAGWHVMKLSISEGSSPIAVDYVEFDIDDERMNLEILQCSIMCIQEADFKFRRPINRRLVTPALVAQRSFETKCAEVDNVNIPIFNSFVKEFCISARLPQYKSFTNRKYENLTNCPHLSPDLWKFSNFILNAESADIRRKNASLMFERGDFAKPNSVFLVAQFNLEGEKEGSIDTKIGNHLYLKFKHLNLPVSVEMKYRERSGRFSKGDLRTFDQNNLEQMWTIPDFTWVEGADNYIVLLANADVKVKFEVDNVRLLKRPMIPEQAREIYKSDDVVVEVVIVNLSWLAPKTMTVKLSNGHIAENVTFIRFYRPIPWNNGYAQVFVLYNDGNVRILPTAPEGLDWIPFGTSVIVGQTDPDSFRPHAVITEVDIIPEQWKMTVLYEDGSSAKFKLNNTNEETQLFVTDINFLKDPFTHPFATIRSMYVDEGNTDVDSVKVDNKRIYNIMDKWGSLEGRSFAFHRRCISRHLTLSPDIQVDILKAHRPRMRRMLTHPVFIK